MLLWNGASGYLLGIGDDEQKGGGRCKTKEFKIIIIIRTGAFCSVSSKYTFLVFLLFSCKFTFNIRVTAVTKLKIKPFFE